MDHQQLLLAVTGSGGQQIDYVRYALEYLVEVVLLLLVDRTNRQQLLSCRDVCGEQVEHFENLIEARQLRLALHFERNVVDVLQIEVEHEPYYGLRHEDRVGMQQGVLLDADLEGENPQPQAAVIAHRVGEEGSAIQQPEQEVFVLKAENPLADYQALNSHIIEIQRQSVELVHCAELRHVAERFSRWQNRFRYVLPQSYVHRLAPVVDGLALIVNVLLSAEDRASQKLQSISDAVWREINLCPQILKNLKCSFEARRLKSVVTIAGLKKSEILRS